MPELTLNLGTLSITKSIAGVSRVFGPGVVKLPDTDENVKLIEALKARAEQIKNSRQNKAERSKRATIARLAQRVALGDNEALDELQRLSSIGSQKSEEDLKVLMQEALKAPVEEVVASAAKIDGILEPSADSVESPSLD